MKLGRRVTCGRSFCSFLILTWVLGQVLTCSEVTGPETHQVVSA